MADNFLIMSSCQPSGRQLILTTTMGLGLSWWLDQVDEASHEGSLRVQLPVDEPVASERGRCRVWEGHRGVRSGPRRV